MGVGMGGAVGGIRMMHTHRRWERTGGALPSVPTTMAYMVVTVGMALGSWAVFSMYATNTEKLSSSILKSVISQVKASPLVVDLLDTHEPIVLKPELWLANKPHIQGSVNMMQGRIDLAFKIHPRNNHTNTATVYFTSIRPHKHAPFHILRFLVIHNHSAKSVNLLDSNLTSIHP